MKQFKTLCNITKQVSKDNGDLVIEGYANRNILDSVGDRVDPFGVKFDRFKLNPMVLFNHNRDLCFGGGVEWKPTDDGLWFKAIIPEPEIDILKQAYKMIKRGILKTFSIGFEYLNGKDMSKDEHLITESMLNEISVVTLPANMASTFSMAKQLGESSNLRELYRELNVMPIKEYIESKIREDLDPEALTNKIVSACGKSLTDVYTEIEAKASEETLEVLSECLGVDKSELEAFSKAEDCDDNDKEDSNDEDKKPSKQTDFEACVSAKLPKLIAEGKPQDQAMAMAISMCQEEGKCQLDLITKENIDYIKTIIAKESEGSEEDDPMNKPPAVKLSDGTEEIARSEVLLQTLVSLIGEMNNKLSSLVELTGQKPEGSPEPEEAMKPVEGDDQEPDSKGDEDTGGSATSASEDDDDMSDEEKQYVANIDSMLKQHGY